jgi:hypothetical protein
MQSIDAPADLSPDSRLREIAALLARGVLRLQQQLPADSPPPDLDLPRETVLSVQRG